MTVLVTSNITLQEENNSIQVTISTDTNCLSESSKMHSHIYQRAEGSTHSTETNDTKMVCDIEKITVFVQFL